MRKITATLVILTITALLILLSACGTSGAGSTATTPAGGKSITGVLKTDYENALPVINQLAIGTFKLEDSGAALTTEQAGQLVTLWKGYRALSNSSTTAAIELENLIGQIEQGYTADQLKAIAGLELTIEDMSQIAQEMNISLQGPGPVDNKMLTEEQQATRQALRQASGGGFSGGSPGGGFPGGPPPEGGGMPPGGGGMPEGGGFGPEAMNTPGAMETAIARGGPQPAGGVLSPALVSALIDYLKSKVQ